MCPCPQQRGWHWRIFNIPSNPNHSMILWLPGAMRWQWLGEWLGMNTKRKHERRDYLVRFQQGMKPSTHLQKSPWFVQPGSSLRHCPCSAPTGCLAPSLDRTKRQRFVHAPQNLSPLLKLSRGGQSGLGELVKEEMRGDSKPFSCCHAWGSFRGCNAQPLIKFS